MIQPVAGTAGGHARRWWVWLAALAGSCLVIVVLAAQPAHAQEALGADVWKEEGKIPADRYALTMPIGFDPAHGAVVSDDGFERLKRMGDSAMHLVAAGFHDAGVMVTRLGLWLLELAFSFTVLEAIRDAVAEFSLKMQNTFVVGIGLDKFAVFLAVFYCGIQLLRRRTAHSLGELTASMLVAVVGATLVANPLQALDTTAMTVRSISVAIMDLASDDPASTSLTEQGYEVPKSMSDQLYTSMIVEPYDIANWGGLLKGNCAKTRDEFLRGPNHADDDLFVKEMWDAGEECHDAVIFNTSMSFNRVGVAALTFVVRVVLLVFNAVLSASVMGGQFMLGQVAVALPLFVVFATVPGTGRQIGLKGLNATGQAGAAVILAGFILTILVTFQTALLGLPNTPLLTRYVMVLVMVIMLWRYRAPVRDMVREILLHFTQRLKTHSPGNIAPNLLGDRELWENSVQKRVKENVVDSSYRGTRGLAGKGIGLLRRKKGAGGPSGDPGAGSGTRRRRTHRRTPTYDDADVGRRGVKQRVTQYGQKWKGRGQAVVNASKKTASVTEKGAKELATISGKGFRGGLKLSRKGLMGAAGVVGALRNPETVGDAAGIVAHAPKAGLKAAGQGVVAAGQGMTAAGRGTTTAAGRGTTAAGRAITATAGRLMASAGRLQRDMSLSYTYRAHQAQSPIPGAAQRDAQRRANHANRAAKRRDRDVQKGRFLP